MYLKSTLVIFLQFITIFTFAAPGCAPAANAAETGQIPEQKQQTAPTQPTPRFPYEEAACNAGGIHFKVILSGVLKKDAPENDYLGGQFITIEHVADSTNTKPLTLDATPVNKDLQSYNFLPPKKTTMCDELESVDLKGGNVGLLMKRDNRPFQDELTLIVYNPADNEIKAIQPNLESYEDVDPTPDGLFFSNVVPRSDVDTVYFTSPLTKRKMQATDYDLKAIKVLTFKDNKILIQTDASISYERSQWKKFFKDKKDYLTTTGWNSKKKKFRYEIIYRASYFNRKESDLEEICIMPASHRGKLVLNGGWRCIQEKN